MKKLIGIKLKGNTERIGINIKNKSMGKISITVFILFISIHSHGQKLNSFFDIMTQRTICISHSIEKNDRNSVYSRDSISIRKDLTKNRRFKNRNIYLSKLNDFLEKNNFKINYKSDTLLVVLSYSIIQPFQPMDAYVRSSKNEINIRMGYNEYANEKYLYPYDFTDLIYKMKLDGLVTYTKKYGVFEAFDGGWIHAYRYTLKDNKIKSYDDFDLPDYFFPQEFYFEMMKKYGI